MHRRCQLAANLLRPQCSAQQQRTRRPCEGTETPGKHSRKHAAIKQRCHTYPQNTPCRWSRLPLAFRSNRALYDGCKLCGWSKPWRLAEVLPSLPRMLEGVRGGRMFLVPLSYDLRDVFWTSGRVAFRAVYGAHKGRKEKTILKKTIFKKQNWLSPVLS